MIKSNLLLSNFEQLWIVSIEKLAGDLLLIPLISEFVKVSILPIPLIYFALGQVGRIRWRSLELEGLIELTLPYTGLAAASTLHRAFSLAWIPALEMDTRPCSITSWIAVRSMSVIWKIKKVVQPCYSISQKFEKWIQWQFQEKTSPAKFYWVWNNY